MISESDFEEVHYPRELAEFGHTVDIEATLRANRLYPLCTTHVAMVEGCYAEFRKHADELDLEDTDTFILYLEQVRELSSFMVFIQSEKQIKSVVRKGDLVALTRSSAPQKLTSLHIARIEDPERLEVTHQVDDKVYRGKLSDLIHYFERNVGYRLSPALKILRKTHG